MIPFRKSLAFRLLLTIYVLLVLPLIVDTFILIHDRYQKALVDAEDYLVQVSNMREAPLAEFFPAETGMRLLINALELNVNFPKKPDKKLDDILKKMVDKSGFGGFSEIDLLTINDGQYIVIATSTDEPIIGRNDTDYINSIKINPVDGTSQNIYISGEREYYYTGTRYVLDNNNKPIGLIIAYFDISEKLSQMLIPDYVRFPIFFSILLSDTVVASGTDTSMLLHYFAIPESFKKNRSLSELNIPFPNKPIQSYSLNRFPFFEFDWKNERKIAYVSRIASTNFYLLAYASKKSIFSYLYRSFFNIYSTYVVVLTIGGIFAYMFAKRLAKPLSNLTEVMNRIQKGESHVRASFDPLGYEINLLSQTFNEMLDTLMHKKSIAEEARVKAEIYKKELMLGEEVQKHLFLEKQIIFPGLDIATKYLPAKEVGGDFCDLFVDKGNLIITIADAAGKGVEACFYSLLLRGMLRIYSREIQNAGLTVSKTNELFFRDTSENGMFVTLVLGIYNPKKKELRYYTAGHNPPLLRRKNGSVEIFQAHGIPLGVDLMKTEMNEEKVPLESGDTLLFYTDGVTEAHNEQKKLFNLERLIEVLNKNSASSADEIAETILKEVKNFAGNAPQHDDITLIVLKVKDD